MYFYLRTLSALPRDCPHWSPVQDLGSTRDLWRRDTKLRVLVKGCSSGGGSQSAPFWRCVRRALTPRRLSGNPRRSLFGGWALPERNVFVGWHRQEDPGREEYCILSSVRQDKSLFNAYQSAPSEKNRVFWKLQQQAIEQAVVSYIYYILALRFSLS